MWIVEYLEEAAKERLELPKAERTALLHAIQKLETVGPTLGFPHTSAVQGAQVELRELRPRAGRSPWRALYRRVDNMLVIAAIAPETRHDQRGFNRAVSRALDRLAEREEKE